MKVLVWNENVHEKEFPLVTELYPGGLHEYIAGFLRAEDVEVKTATLDQPDCGLSEELLAETDVLVWWSHCAHGEVADEIVEMIHRHVLMGMGFIALHSSHYAKVFRKLMGTSGTLKWRDDERERIWTILPNHPIAANVPESFVLEQEEMYGEPFGIPEPMETVFLGWYKGGEVFRSGCTWVRGNGKVFYFQPGHETNTAYQNPHVQQILKNAVRWACPVKKTGPLICTHVEPVES